MKMPRIAKICLKIHMLKFIYIDKFEKKKD